MIALTHMFVALIALNGANALQHQAFILNHGGARSLVLSEGGGANAFCQSAQQLAHRFKLDEKRTRHLCPPVWASPRQDEYESSGKKKESNSGKKKKKKDPYAGIDYDNIELEFVDYSDPDYQLDQDVELEGQKELMGADEETLEQWREERRKRNDEYQFETYFQNIWSSGECEYRGEWTTYGTTTFIPELQSQGGGEGSSGAGDFPFPGLVQAKRTVKVISKASRHMINPDAEWRGDREVIRHAEYEVSNEAAEPSLARRRDADIDSGFGRHTDDERDSEEKSRTKSNDDNSSSLSRRQVEAKYWPAEMKSFDFRGPQGNMCVGTAYTICDAIPLFEEQQLEDENENHNGPFKEKRIEIGIHEDDMRMRVKFFYKVKEGDLEDSSLLSPPPLHLCTITVCRERKEDWPCGVRDVNLFGPAGAKGGLYDPPPVGGEKQAARYMGMDVEGGASILFPHAMEQTANAFGTDSEFSKYNWVVSLDWTPSGQRYQVDRKFFGGPKSKGLKSLELSEVQALQAETYRPRKGPADMRQ